MSTRRRALTLIAAAAVIGGIMLPAHALPNPPQIGELPGASSIPNLSQAPVQIPGFTLNEPPVTDPAVGGTFGAPFAQPGTSCPHENEGMPANNPTSTDIVCKPTAVSVAVLPNGSVLYWDGIEAQERDQYADLPELGDNAINDQSRVLTLNYTTPASSSWAQPTPVDGGAREPSSQDQYLIPNAPAPLNQVFNDPGHALGALFCSDLVFLANGKLLVPGGTHYYSEPHVPNTGYGVLELEGLRATRIFDPVMNKWSQSGDMNFGRWYPSLVTLGNGKVFVASGVTKLIKPIYSKHPLLSGTNVEQTETYDPATGKWTNNGPAAKHTLPLFPRLHLLPDGKVYYDAAGQVFNPAGEAYDEALWNLTAVYDPAKKTWTNLGVPFGISADPGNLNVGITAGFRGSSFSVMLPLVPDSSGNYTKASFLSAGGVLGVTPGAYFSNTSSIVNTVDTATGDAFSSAATAPLNNARWFSTGVLLPTGQAIAFSGANRDEVVGAGSGFPVHQAELFDPATGTWTRLASGVDDRTYHNTAVLLPTGQVLVGGHSPISTFYGYDQTLPGGFSNNWRDPSFELYNPPYLYWGVPRPTVTPTQSLLHYGESAVLGVGNADPGDIASVVLVRNPALTHLVDGDQREVVLPITQRGSDGTITVTTPPSGNVAPPGPYMLFINKRSPRGLVPSVASQVFVEPVGIQAPPLPITGLSSVRGTSSQPVRSNATTTPVLSAKPVSHTKTSSWPVAAAALAVLVASASLVTRRRMRGVIAKSG